MRRYLSHVLILILLALPLVSVQPSGAQDQSITIAWAEWDPANYLVELSKDFTKQTGIKVVPDFVPWGNFQDKVFTEFAARGSAFDVVIGDSQWLGRGATQGHYVELTDWMKQNVKVADIEPATLTYYAEFPKGSKRYWALPAEGDAIGWAYRKDLLDNAAEKSAFQKKFGYVYSVPPKSWSELRDIARHFTRPDKKLYGVALYTQKDYDAITMGYQNVMWSWGGAWGNEKTYQVRGIADSKANIDALTFYRDLFKCCAPPGSGNYFWQESVNAHQQGLVAMSMNYFAFFPGLINPKQNPHAKATGFFAMPGQKGADGKVRRFASLGGQGMSIPTYSKKKELAFRYLKWFAEEQVQRKWAQLGGYTTNRKVLASKEFLAAAPFNKAFAETMPMVRDFWAVPEYADLLLVAQTQINGAVLGQWSPEQAMKKIAAEWHKVFEQAGYYKKK